MDVRWFRRLAIVGGLLGMLIVGLGIGEGPVQAQEAATIPPEIISYWKLDETSGSFFADAVGTSPAVCVTSSSCPNPLTGTVGKAQNFARNTGLMVAHNARFDFANADSFTIEAWVKLDVTSCEQPKVFVGKYSSGASWWLGCSRTSAGDVATFSGRDSSGVSFVVQGTQSLTDGKWHHVVGRRNGTTTTFRVFVDGVQQDSLFSTFSGSISNSNPLTIGYYQSPFAYQHYGAIDEIAIWHVALEHATIRDHYNKGLAGKGYIDVDERLTMRAYIPLIFK